MKVKVTNKNFLVKNFIKYFYVEKVVQLWDILLICELLNVRCVIQKTGQLEKVPLCKKLNPASVKHFRFTCTLDVSYNNAGSVYDVVQKLYTKTSECAYWCLYLKNVCCCSIKYRPI